MHTVEIKFESSAVAEAFVDWFSNSGEQAYMEDNPFGANTFEYVNGDKIFATTQEKKVEPVQQVESVREVESVTVFNPTVDTTAVGDVEMEVITPDVFSGGGDFGGAGAGGSFDTTSSDSSSDSGSSDGGE